MLTFRFSNPSNGEVGSLQSFSHTRESLYSNSWPQDDNEPIIPASTRFFLTTDNSLVPEESASTSYGSADDEVSLKYFDRPDVIASYSRQERIQTPMVERVDTKVGSRFRPRGEGVCPSVYFHVS